MRKLGLLLLSFCLVLSFEVKLELGTVVEKMLVEDRSLAEKIMFDTIFRQILERSLLLKKLVDRSLLLKKFAKVKSNEEFEDTWSSRSELEGTLKSRGELKGTWKSRGELEETWKSRGELEGTWSSRSEIAGTWRKTNDTVRSKSLPGKDLFCKDEKEDTETWGTSVMTAVPDLVPNLVKEEFLDEGDRLKMSRGQLPWLGGRGVRIM